MNRERRTQTGQGQPLGPSESTDSPSSESALFPISAVASYLQGAGVPVSSRGNELSWRGGAGCEVGIRVKPLALVTDDGLHVVEQAQVLLDAPWLRNLDDGKAEAVNQLATVGGFVRPSGSSTFRLVSKVGIFRGDKAAAERVYAPVMAGWAAALPWMAERLARGELAVPPELSPYHRTDEVPPVTDWDLAQALEHGVQALGLLGSLGSGSLAAEFPWDEGALSQVARLPGVIDKLRKLAGVGPEVARRAGGRTALLLIRTDVHHPWFGRGVRCTLELPLPTKGPEALQLIHDLNRWELETPDLPPYFGAWVLGPRAPMFLTFIPNQMCVPGSVVYLVHWARVRAGSARRWLLEAGAWN